MRFFVVLLACSLLAGCVSSRKYKDYVALSENLFVAQQDSIRMLQDSTLRMRLAVERLAGRNDALLASQDKYLDRLQLQEDEIDELRGNLSSTSSQMTTQLAELRRQLSDTKARFDTLREEQTQRITTFEEAAKDAAVLLDTMLRNRIDPTTYAINTAAGTVTLSVQEEVLFRTGAVSQTNDEAAFVLRSVTEALQDDPLLKLTVVGHTDNRPSPRRKTDNWTFAALRAAFLADELTQTYYVSPNRVTAASRGEFGPRTSNSTPEGQRANRRIDFVLSNNVGNLLRALNQLSGE